MVQRTRRPSPGLLVGVVALVVALTGSAVALPGNNKVDKNDIKKGAVTKKAIKKGAVTKKAIKKGAVTTKALKGSAVTTPKVAAGAIDGGKIAEGAIDDSKVVEDSLSTSKLSEIELSKSQVVAATSGPSFDAARTAAPAHQMFASGPLSVYGKCFTDTTGPTTHAYTYVATTQAGSVFVGNNDSLWGDPFLDPSTDEEEREIMNASVSTNSSGGWRSIFQIAAPDGASLQGEVAMYAKNGSLPGGNGIYGTGDSCVFSGFVQG